MSKEKQIEEMSEVYEKARLKARETLGSMNEGEGVWYSKAFYEAGYRKQSEVALGVIESFADMEKPYVSNMCVTPCNLCKNSLRGNRNKRCGEELQCYGFNKWESLIEHISAELKKKYTEGKT